MNRFGGDVPLLEDAPARSRRGVHRHISRNPFEASAKVTRDDRPFIHFTRDGKNRARAYEGCWGHYYNEQRTRIGMYCVAVVEAVR